MIVFDLINDEAPLFIEGVEKLLREKFFQQKEEVVGVVEGRRWLEESKNLTCINRLHFFDGLDAKEIDITSEISRISKTYDNFNIYACDRYLIEKPIAYQEKMLVYTYLFYEDLFSKKVDYYFTTGIAYTYNLVSFQVAKRFDVKHVSFYGTRIENRTAISLDVVNTFDEVLNSYKTFQLEKVTQEMYAPIDAFINRPQQPNYMANAINSSSLKFIFIKEFFIRFKRYYFSSRHTYDLFTRNPLTLSSFRLKKIINAKKINLYHNSIFDKVNDEDSYFVFPLHMQPEASTLVLSPFNVDQQNTIVNISKLLPPSVLLYVKEHRSALGQHSKKFYKELKKHPNIRLISYKENMFELIKNSLGTINLSSTVGLESLIMKKPALLLGNVFYNDSGLTFKVASYEEIQQKINLILEGDFKVEGYFENYSDRLAFYIDCLKKESYPFEFNVAKLDTKKKVLAKKNIEEFSNCIKKITAGKTTHI